MLSVIGRNLPLKLLSLFLAILLWSVVSRGRGGEMMEISVGIPVELHNLPPDLEVMRDLVERVNVRFTGPRRIVSGISHMGLSIPVDLTGAAEGETTIELFNSDIKVPERVTVTRVSPSSVSVFLERTVRKEVPVELALQGTVKEGFAVSAITMNPKTVDIRGPRSILNSINNLRTSVVNVEGAGGPLVGETSLILPEDSVHALKWSTVKYEIQIVEKMTEPGKKR
ncbi:MAG: CdaR family protein [bacterium]|nr:CdaR family protein [bacterium]MDT8396115.1 CdaR family protein [bacterium]